MTSVELTLWQAARDGRNDVVMTLLKKNVDIELKDDQGWTALHYAACDGHNDVVQILLENQATVDAETLGDTPLSWAALKGHNTVVRTLLENRTMHASMRPTFMVPHLCA